MSLTEEQQQALEIIKVSYTDTIDAIGEPKIEGENVIVNFQGSNEEGAILLEAKITPETIETKVIGDV